jgi:membrane-bound inhibitor of C-type lysozyme
MKIIWDKVTKLSQVVAIILFLAVFYVGMMLGRGLQTRFILGEPINKATFVCEGGEKLYVEFFERMAHVERAHAKSIYLPQTISASGARYANKDESLVFWNKGDSAFLQQNGQNLYDGCVVQE